MGDCERGDKDIHSRLLLFHEGFVRLGISLARHMKFNIQPFIFTWKRHFKSACTIEDQLKEIFPKVTVINSDDDNTREGWINIGDSCYFGAQFRKALSLFTGNILFHIQADVEYDKWNELVEDAKFYLRYYEAGIYAPNVDYTWYSGDKTDFTWTHLKHSHLKCVGSTDETVWFIHKAVLDGLTERGIDTNQNPLGWGWDSVLSAISYSKGLPVIRDYRHTIKHPQGTGYDHAAATAQMDALVASLDPDLQQIHSYIRGERQMLAQYLERRSAS